MATAKKTNPDTLPQSSGFSLRSSRTEDPDLSGSVGQVIAQRYQLDALLGRGGMGEVWRALHIVTQRAVAVKLLRRTLAYNPDMRRRFLRESRAAAAVDHPNVVQVLDAFEADDGCLALVMPLLEGETLRSLLTREGQLDLDSTLSVMLPLISAVSAAHQRGIVHRDLKPDNVFLASEHGESVVKVLDFGVAKLIEADLNQGTLTGTGAVLGTPGYMAPEQALAEHDQDHGVDIWALGVIAYEALSGCKPVEGENSAQLIRSLLTQAITPLDVLVAGLPEPVTQVVMRMLQRDRVNRPRDLDEVAEVLRVFLPGYVSPRVPVLIRNSRPPATPVHTPSAHADLPLALAETASLTPPVGTTLVSGSQRPPEHRRARLLPIGAGLALIVGAYWWLTSETKLPNVEGLPTSAAQPVSTHQVASALPEAKVSTPEPPPASVVSSTPAASASLRPKAAPLKAPKAAAAVATPSPPLPSAPRARPADGLQEEPPF